MKKEKILPNLIKLTSDTGFFARADRTATYEGDIFLGKYDEEKNYIEISVEEKNAIDKEIEARYDGASINDY